MSDYNLVKIGTVYLTTDGLVGGLPCRTEVAGLAGLKSSKTGNVALAADGTPYLFVQDNIGAGSPLNIKPFVLTKAVFDSIVTAINAALNASTIINITLAGDTGNFDLDCYPAIPNAIVFPGSFSNQRIDGVEFNFVIKEIN